VNKKPEYGEGQGSTWAVVPWEKISYKLTDVSEVRTASIIRAMIALKRRSTSKRIRGAVSQKAVIFEIVPVCTENYTKPINTKMHSDC
jgi:hypothetical protein